MKIKEFLKLHGVAVPDLRKELPLATLLALKAASGFKTLEYQKVGRKHVLELYQDVSWGPMQ